VVEAAEIASKADDPESIYGYTQLHSLFIANYTLTNKVSWKELDQNGLIFGRNYASNGINYTLRAPSMGSTVDTTNGKIFPTNNEWDQILAKAPWSFTLAIITLTIEEALTLWSKTAKASQPHLSMDCPLQIAFLKV